MHYYRTYPYYRRYYHINPYYYGRYYPFYNYQQNVIDSQIADVDQSIVNYGDMTDVVQDADVYQSMSQQTEKPKIIEEISPPIQPTLIIP